MGKADDTTVNALLSDMDTLKGLLEYYHFKDNNRIELAELENVVNKIRANIGTKKKKKMYFSTDNGGIRFHTSTMGMNPNPGMKEQKIDLTLTLTYEYTCEKTELKDMVRGYNLNIQIEGFQKNHGAKHYFEWLQDVLPPKSNKNKKYQFIHPYYHFHAGGAFLKAKGPGSLMQLSSPRLPYPPMDIVLAVNFIICNFFSTKETKFQEEMKILDDEDYQKLVERAARRLYVPYYKEINSDVTKSEFMPLFTT